MTSREGRGKAAMTSINDPEVARGVSVKGLLSFRAEMIAFPDAEPYVKYVYWV